MTDSYDGATQALPNEHGVWLLVDQRNDNAYGERLAAL